MWIKIFKTLKNICFLSFHNSNMETLFFTIFSIFFHIFIYQRITNLVMQHKDKKIYYLNVAN